MKIFTHYFREAFIHCFVFTFLVLTSVSYAQTKWQYLSTKVPVNHDFTTVDPAASYRPGHLLVRFAPDLEGKQRVAAEHQNTMDVLGGGVLKRSLMPSEGLYLIELPENLTVEEALKVYNRNDEIYYAEPDYRVEIFSTIPNDTRFSELWGCTIQGNPAERKMPILMLLKPGILIPMRNPSL